MILEKIKEQEGSAPAHQNAPDRNFCGSLASVMRPSAALAALLCAPLALAGLVDTCSDITDADKCVAHKNCRAGEPKN